MSIVLPENYGLVVITASIIAFQVHAVSFGVSAIRKSIFGSNFHLKNRENKEYQTMLEEHKKVTGSDKLNRDGYPDMGNGFYSKFLSYADWLKFNNAQRAHYNYVEGAASVLAVHLLSGLFFPQVSALLGLVYIVGRALYSSGYKAKGAGGRIVGVVLLDSALILMLGLAVYGGYKSVAFDKIKLF